MAIKEKKLGEMLLDENLITRAQLQVALEEQKKLGLKIGQCLIRQGILNEQQLVQVISRQLKIERYDPQNYDIGDNLASLIPYEIVSKYQVAPLRKRGRLLSVAMADPTDMNILDSLEIITNDEVEPVVCTERELNYIINSIYGIQQGIGRVLENIAVDAQLETSQDTDDSQAEDIKLASLQSAAGEAPVIRLVNSILAQAVSEGASDVHISPQQSSIQLRFRIDGKLLEMPSPPKSLCMPMVARIKILAGMDITVSRIPQDGRFTMRAQQKEINCRASCLPTLYGENVVLRLLDVSNASQYSLDRLGMIESDQKKIASVSNMPYGMILSTGPTGSGKSTSLYSILNLLDKPDINIITLEDPVEYRINTIRQVQLNRKAGMTFASGLRSILRQDPDVIMVGEIRDAETATISVQAAQTGHRVLSTVHTNDAAGAITRLIDMGIEPFLVASVLLTSFAQRLVRTNCSYCKTSYAPSEKSLAALGLDKSVNADFQRGAGCHHCMNTGYRGRTGIFEVLIIDEMIQDMIMKGISSREITREASMAGKLRTLKEDAADKVLKGITSLEEAASMIMT